MFQKLTLMFKAWLHLGQIVCIFCGVSYFPNETGRLPLLGNWTETVTTELNFVFLIP